MKTKFRRFSKRSLSMVLAILMMTSIIAVGTISVSSYTTLASKYILFDNTNTGYSTVYCYIGHASYAKSYTMSKVGSTNIWKLSFDSNTAWTDRTKLYFANHNDSPNGQNYGIDTQYGWNTTGSTRTALITANNADGGSCFFPAGNNSSTLTRRPLRVVAGDIASNGWSNTSDTMSYSSSTHTKTYSNVATGDYSFAVVGFDDWNTAYRWAAKGTLTANGAGSWADAADDDNNIKLTLTKKASVQISLTSSNKVNVTLTPVTHSVTRTAPTNGSLELSTDNSTFGTSTISVAEGDNYYVKATPNTGYKINALKVGGSTISAANGKTSAYTYTGTMGTSDVATSCTFSARTFTVTLNANGGSGGTASVTGTYGSAMPSANMPTRDGYTFAGYYDTDATSGGTQYYTAAGASARTWNKTSNTTLYARWTINTYTIKKTESGASGGTATIGSTTITTSNQNVNYGTYTLTVTAPSGYNVKTVTGVTGTWSGLNTGTATLTGYTHSSNVTLAITYVSSTVPGVTVTANYDNSSNMATIGTAVTVTATKTHPTGSAGAMSIAVTYNGSAATAGTQYSVTSSTSGNVTTYTITPNKAGTFVVTASYSDTGNPSNSVTFGVSTPTVAFGTTTAASINVGGTLTRTATGSTVGTVTSDTITYSSDATAVATVSSSGVITGKTPGTANISATRTIVCGGQTTTVSTTTNIAITVKTPAVSLSGDSKVAIGDTKTLTPSVTNVTGTPTYTYSSSATSKATVNNSGVVTGVAAGTVTITVTATLGTWSDTATKSITVEAPSLTIADIANNSTQYLALGTNITNKTLTTNFSNPSYTKTSSNSSVATASITSGKLTVTSVAKGKATITVTATKGSTISVTQTFTVKVSEAETYKYLYFTNGVSWSGVNAYFYGDGENASFPGESMTKIATNENSQKVYAIRYPATKNYTNVIISDSSNSSNRVNIGGTTDIALSSSHNAIWCNTANTNDGTNAANWYDCTISRPQISADDIADLPINTSTSLTADVLTNTTPSKFKWSSASTSIATVGNSGDTGTTNYNTITGVYPGTTTITITAYSPVPTNWTLVTDGTADTYVAGTATASVTVTATPKTVTWGTKVSTDNGSTYSTNSSAGTVTVTNGPSSSGGTVAHGTQVTFSASTNSGYKFAGWQVDGNNTITTTTTKTVTVNANTTVYALYYKTYTVTLTAGTGFKTGSNKKYRIGSSGSYSTYSSALTVNQGAEVYFQVAYSTGYEYNGVTNATVVTANTVFKTAAISGDLTVTITAKKTKYALTAVVSPNYGNLKFYSNATCTTQITTATYQQTFYAKYDPNGTGYNLKTASISGTGSSITATNTSTGIITCKMGYAATTVTATVILQYSATYYVDMHNHSVSTLTVSVTNSSGTVLQDSNGNNCTASLTQQGTSTVYSATINTPVTQSGTSYSTLYFKITYNGTPYNNTLTGTQVATMIGNTSHEIWLEAENDADAEVSKSNATNSTLAVASGFRRIYLRKPYNWQSNEPNWKHVGIYWWGGDTNLSWDSAPPMNYVGQDGTGSSNYHYYYYDIPASATSIIFKAGGNGSTYSYQNIQTADITLSGNYYTLTKDGNNYKGTAVQSTDTAVPAYTKYVSAVTMKKSESTQVSIKPTNKAKSIKYISSNTNVVKVTSNGVLQPQAKGSATIKVRVLGTAGDMVYTSSYTDSDKDQLYYTVNVTITDPNALDGFNIMSLASATSTITIPTVNSDQPGYFDFSDDDMEVRVSGLANVAADSSKPYTSSAIVTQTETYNVPNAGSKPITYTVKYAAPSSFTGYSNITVKADVVSKSISYSQADRYGYDHWNKGSTPDGTITADATVNSGIERAYTEGITLDGSTFSEIFVKYDYVDVTFTYDYYEYKTAREVPVLDDDGNDTGETEIKQYNYYAPDWVGTEDRNSASFQAAKHDHKTYTAPVIEVRYKTANNITVADCFSYTYTVNNVTKTYTPAISALKKKPDNSYYTYTLDASTIQDKVKKSAYTATFNVKLKHAPKTYEVKVDGTNVKNPNEDSTNYNTNNYYYQEYAKLSSSGTYIPSARRNGTLNWIKTDSNNSVTGATLATTKSYNFRVLGNTYLKTTAGTIADADFNRSKVTHTGQEVKYESNTPQIHNNFYVSDYFDASKNPDPDNDNLPYQNGKFVGGGIVYYQVDNNGNPSVKPVNGGYVDGTTGNANADEIKDFLNEKISERTSNDTIVPSSIPADDPRRVEIAYGTEIAATADSASGLRFKYVPFERFNRNNGVLETEEKDGEYVYTFATTTNSDVFRYSNSLRSYQYIYDDVRNNNTSNIGKNIRLYSYYVYSYTKYDKTSGIPSTVYEIKLSAEHAEDASTYLAQNSNDVNG